MLRCRVDVSHSAVWVSTDCPVLSSAAAAYVSAHVHCAHSLRICPTQAAVRGCLVSQSVALDVCRTSVYVGVVNVIVDTLAR